VIVQLRIVTKTAVKFSNHLLLLLYVFEVWRLELGKGAVTPESSASTTPKTFPCSFIFRSLQQASKSYYTFPHVPSLQRQLELCYRTYFCHSQRDKDWLYRLQLQKLMSKLNMPRKRCFGFLPQQIRLPNGWLTHLPQLIPLQSYTASFKLPGSRLILAANKLPTRFNINPITSRRSKTSHRLIRKRIITLLLLLLLLLPLPSL